MLTIIFAALRKLIPEYGMSFLTLWLLDVFARASRLAIRQQFANESVRLKDKETKLKEFCKQNNLQLDSSRVQAPYGTYSSAVTAGFGRSAAQKAVWAKKREVEKINRRGIIEKDQFMLHSDKIDKFLLKPGAKHSKEFFDVGYSENDFSLLLNDIVSEFVQSKAFDFKKHSSGAEDFSMFMYLGVKHKKRFRLVWRKDMPDSKPRLITGHRED